MTTPEAVKLAEALGRSLFRIDPTNYDMDLGTQSLREDEDLEQFIQWLSTAEGEKAVRNKVRELCRQYGWICSVKWAWWDDNVLLKIYDEEFDDSGSALEPLYQTITLPYEKAECAALVWLTEKGEKK